MQPLTGNMFFEMLLIAFTIKNFSRIKDFQWFNASYDGVFEDSFIFQFGDYFFRGHPLALDKCATFSF